MDAARILRAWVNITHGRTPYQNEQTAFNQILPSVQMLSKEYDVQFCNTPADLRSRVTEHGVADARRRVAPDRPLRRRDDRRLRPEG